MEFHVFFFIISSIAVFMAESSFVQSSGSAKDVQHLISFKSTLKDPTLLENWNPSSNPCDFTGVSCKGSRVSALSISEINLNTVFSHVSSFLLSIENLEILSLRSVNLTGNLSVHLGFYCSEMLREIDLSGNDLTGSISEIWSLSSCPNLKSLNLSRNLLDFTEKGKESSIKLDLETMDLSSNRIFGSDILSWILSSGCKNLRYLDLHGNTIIVVTSISDCVNLEYLDLSSNKISGKIPSFGECMNLRYLDLSLNDFSGNIGNTLSSCKQLEILNLSNNGFSGNFPSLSGINLVDLDLSFNNLSGSFPNDLASCFTLESIVLSNNNFNGDLPVEIFSSMPSLKKIILSYNHFSGVLPQSLSNLTNIEVLDLSSNEIHGSIPSQLCQNPRNSFKEVYLQNNYLIGNIPDTLSNCTGLISLDLSFNYLRGTIPYSLGSLSHLRDLIMWLNQLHGDIPEQLTEIRTLENLILDNNMLTGPIPGTIGNCTNLNWISLSSNQLSGEIPTSIGQLKNLAILKLANNSFSGRIPPELGDCKSLIWLDLNSNLLNGTIPSALAKQSGNIAVGLVTGKRYVYLRNVGSIYCHGTGNLLEFAGIRPESLNRVPTLHSCNFTRVYAGSTHYTFMNNGSMIFLDLSYNLLEGSIPKELGNMFYLTILNLGHNFLSGAITPELGNLRNVGVLDLSHNCLQGPIPGSFSGLSMLSEIDLSNNNLTGSIPELGQLATFPASKYENNSGLCGFPLPSCGQDRGLRSPNFQHQKSHWRRASLAGTMAIGFLFSLFCGIGLIIIYVENKKRNVKKRREDMLDNYINSQSHSGTAKVSWKLTGAKEALSISLATFEKPLQKLTFADLLESTNGFHNDSIIGSGGFGDVYKAQLKDGKVVAIKKLIHISGQGEREFTAEMETIGRIKHRNLVPLLGYCKVGEERLLVYEYMKFGSLDDVLHDRKKIGIVLNWPMRRKLAVGAARGLAFLHHSCIPHIIHRDMKSSNVLVDENFEARVADFGMARLMNAVDTHLSVSTLAGTPGYVPPEYYQSFRCSTKGDVYSYGVVLLELLTGKQPTDSSDFGDSNLVGWVMQHAKVKISKVFDPILLKEDPSLEMELLQHLKIACACLDERPWKRPTMLQVMAMFKEIQMESGREDWTTTTDGNFEVVEVSLKEGPETEKP